MLLRLEIHDLAIVESLSFRPSDGLNVLTGETGAGKSVIARALGLLLGERASVAVVRSGCEAAHVLGEWELDGERFVIERSVPGRATLNGEKVPLSTLQKLAPRLMARTPAPMCIYCPLQTTGRGVPRAATPRRGPKVLSMGKPIGVARKVRARQPEAGGPPGAWETDARTHGSGRTSDGRAAGTPCRRMERAPGLIQT